MVLASLNYGFENGRMSATQSKGVIVLLPKGGNEADKHLLTTYRPISLTCCDYKICASVLAKHLQGVIQSIISTDQTAYIKGRGIFQNLGLIKYVIYQSDIQNIHSAIVALDFSKAFDSISKYYMITVLKTFNFPSDFVKWVEVLNADSKNCVSNYGHMTAWFPIGKGVRQGCPLSDLLFVLSIEPLACKIRQSKLIRRKDLFYNQIAFRLTQYAVDITLFLKDAHSVEIAINILQEFKIISGLALNKTKTKAIWLGCDRECQDTPGGNLWKTDGIKFLGVTFRNKGTAADNLENWENIMQAMEKSLNSWKRRNIFILGRVTVVKSLLLSKIVLLVLIPPENVRKKINSIIFKFIWKNKIEKVKRNNVIQSFEDGGIHMLNVGTLCKKMLLKWTQRLVEENKAMYFKIPTQLLCKYVPNYHIFNFNCAEIK